MDQTKKAWAEIVTPEDLDSHLEVIGQAAANGQLTAQILSDFPLKQNANLLIPGAGTGQLLDFVEADTFQGLQITMTEINRLFIESIKRRIKRNPKINAVALFDDIENTNLIGQTFDAVLGILLLEHIDWKKGITQILKLHPHHLFFIIQEQESTGTMITKRELAPTIKKFAEVAKPHLVERSELITYLNANFTLSKVYETVVLDSKRMAGLVFKAI